MADDVQETTETATDDKPDQKPADKPADRPAEDKELDSGALKTELARARADAAKYRVDAQKWRAHEEAQLSAQQKAEKAQQEAERRLAAIELERDRAKVALKYKLDDELADVLAGSTREELEANAAKLAKRVKSAPDLMPGRRGAPVGKSESNVDDFIRSIGRR